MKKALFISIIALTSVILSSCCISHNWVEPNYSHGKMCSKCGEETGSPIPVSFRGISFGTNYTDVVNQLAEQGINEFYPDGTSIYILDPVDAADYKMSIILEFTSSTDPHATIENSDLYQASYFLEDTAKSEADWRSIASDLLAKLEKQYGKTDDFGKDSHFFKSHNLYTSCYAAWDFPGYTVMLSGSYSSSEEPYIAIDYTWKYGEEIKKNNTHTIIEENNAQKNSDGL